MKKTAILALVAVLLPLSAMAQKKISVLGDSYSTFLSYMASPDNAIWYFPADDKRHEKENDVTDVSQTWWSILTSDKDCQLEVNDSYSGATVCFTGYDGKDFSDRSFITRMGRLGNPDIILVFGGTNDSWAGSPAGKFQFGGFRKEDLYSFRPAFAHLIELLKLKYTGARIINICNSELKDEITESMFYICGHYGVECLQLHDIDKQKGHPSQKGMKSIADQVLEAVKQ